MFGIPEIKKPKETVVSGDLIAITDSNLTVGKDGDPTRYNVLIYPKRMRNQVEGIDGVAVGDQVVCYYKLQDLQKVVNKIEKQ